MRIKSELQLIVFLALYNFSSASDGKSPSEKDPRDADLCYWMSAADRRILYSFLRESAEAHTNALRLYLSTWTSSHRLVDCVIVEEPAITEYYLSLCREKRSGNLLGHPEERLNVTRLLAPDSPCVTESVVGFEQSHRLRRDLQPADSTLALQPNLALSAGPEVRRRKRSWIFPGTLWCGTGTKANAYDDIGLFDKADRCCREHDHCSNVIPAFRVNYGVFNHNLYTVSHCDCDLRFRQCLQEMNDTIANMVGYSFFSVLKVPCFTFILKKHCTQLTWFGLCKTVEVAPYAVFSYPTPYNNTQVVEQSTVTTLPAYPTGNRDDVTSSSTSRNGTTPVLRAETCSPQSREPKTSKHRGHCGARISMRGDTFQPSPKTKSGGRGRKTSGKPPTAAPGSRTSVTTIATSETPVTPVNPTTPFPLTTYWAAARMTTPSPTAKRRGSKKQPDSNNALPLDLPLDTQKHANRNLPAPVENTRHKDVLQLCDCYKQLDECQHRILPYEHKYGLYNTEPKVLYHCNCTRGLSRELRQLTDPAPLQSLLLDFVSLFCFKGLHLDRCLRGKRSVAVLSDSKHLKQTLRRLGVPEDIGGPVRSALKVKRQNSRKSRRRSTPVRLYNRCLRITSKKQQNLRDRFSAPEEKTSVE
ncbi:hypothetical protein GJAV_G00036490 [Gymnothorax javanicus]|nr:hypothetical protein GJAV_G00036490 [Gymnothorax javanicus]